MRRRDLAFALLLASRVGTGRAQERAKQHRIAIVISAGPLTRIGDKENRFWRAFFEELSRLGDVEGQNLTIERYSGEGRPEGFADLTRRVVDRNPDLIVAIANQIALAARAATGTIPIVWTGVEPVRAGLARSLAHPGGNITGITNDTGTEIWGKRLQILKEVIPSASKIAFLGMRVEPEGPATQQFSRQLRELGQQLQISAIPMMLLRESTPAEFQRVFHEIAADQPDAILVSDIPDLSVHGNLILESVDRSRLPAMYPYRNYVEAGGLMAYASDLLELGRRVADDVHQILNGAKPGDIPIYQPTKFEFLINLKAAKALGLTVPPWILARADEVIE
jgi:putative tryptophan/tyrosine transport system substrate-binding protein